LRLQHLELNYDYNTFASYSQITNITFMLKSGGKMNRIAIVIALFLSLTLHVTSIELDDPSIKTDYKEWELIKTEPIPEVEHIDNRGTQEYQGYALMINTKPYKLTFKNPKGNILWTKTNLRSDVDWTFFERDSRNKGIIDYNRIEDGFTLTSGNRGSLVDGDGNCLLMDKTYNRYVFVDKKGTETLLPPNSASLDFLGLFFDKYLMFYQLDEEYYQSAFESNPDAAEPPIYPPFNMTTTYSNVKHWCVIFDKNGAVFKQFKLPDTLIPDKGDIYFNNAMTYLVYEGWNTEKNTQGYVLMSTTGEVHKEGSDLSVFQPAFSEDGTLWVPNTGMSVNVNILNIKIGEPAFNLDQMNPNGAAISNPETGYLLLTQMEFVSLLDYKNLKWLLMQYHANTRYSNPWISGDGKEIRYTYQEKDKPAERKTYRLK
jgi:hypothetical protein